MLFFGAGEAAVGIADLITAALVAQGLPEAEARKRCWLVDSKGLVVASRTDLTDHKRKYAHDHAPVGDFASAVNALKPQAIVGVAAVGRTFTKPIIEAMSVLQRAPDRLRALEPDLEVRMHGGGGLRVERAAARCSPAGAPSPRSTSSGKTFVPRQCNNSYIFPGVGLGVVAAKARRVTDEMFLAAADTLAGMVTEADLAQGSIYPPLKDMRTVSAAIATSVAEVVFKRGLAGVPKPADTAGVHPQEHVRPDVPDVRVGPGPQGRRRRNGKGRRSHVALFSCGSFGRGERIRTFDPLHPMQVRYQAALRPDRERNYSRTGAPPTRESRAPRAYSLSSILRMLLSSLRMLAGEMGWGTVIVLSGAWEPVREGTESSRRLRAPLMVKPCS